MRIGLTTIAYIVPNERQLSSSTAAATSSGVPLLTLAQRRVLRALCRPLVGGRFGTPGSNQQIAEELFLGVETVKSHMHSLFEAFASRACTIRNAPSSHGWPCSVV
jgi:DNA-binding NarL/FixJ family response regulator